MSDWPWWIIFVVGGVVVVLTVVAFAGIGSSIVYRDYLRPAEEDD